ncbi:MAG: thiamine pyrophosphate-dependent enzyme [Candidatus Daviesbacteria bacterium]
MKLEDIQSTCPPNWCPGCGNFGIFTAFKNAAVEKGWNSSNSVLVTGIGCHNNILNAIKITSVKGLHGRGVPVATGIKLANHKLNIFVFTGDGDCLGEGGNHFIHAARRNHDINVLIHNNGLYSLTTGQASPATQAGAKTKSTPFGNPDKAFSIPALAIASGATFVARGYALDTPKLTELIKKAQEHQGFSVIDILQPCITLNKELTPTFYKENTYYLEESYDSTNKEEAFKKSLEWGPKQIPLGIIYQEEKPSFEASVPQLKEKTLIEIPLERNIGDLLKKYS